LPLLQLGMNTSTLDAGCNVLAVLRVAHWIKSSYFFGMDLLRVCLTGILRVDAVHVDVVHVDVAHVDVTGVLRVDVLGFDEAHLDVVHVDVAHVDVVHVDVAHVDVAHVDVVHVDVAHVDVARVLRVEVVAGVLCVNAASLGVLEGGP
jgi:hypothetical protein